MKTNTMMTLMAMMVKMIMMMITMMRMREMAILVCKKSLAALPGIAYCEGEEGRHFSTVDLSGHQHLQHASRSALFVCLLC